ncbi:MAG: hypothetical protein ABIQ31_26030 [Ferruginibacter sp.]
MDTLKIKTLEQVSDASELVENARADHSLTPTERLELEKVAVKLRNLERSIIKIVQQELVETLTADSAALKVLAEQIKKSSEKLSGIADTIEKASKVVDAFIKIVTTAAASGLI